MYICMLGRQPALGLAELESLYGAENIRTVGAEAALVDADVDFARLGGTVKAGEVLTTLPGVNPQKAFVWLQKNISEITAGTKGKLKLGVSLYNLPMPVQKIGANTLSLKKVLRTAEHSVRVVPNQEPALSSAQTHHNNLTDERGFEFLMLRDGDNTIVARAVYVQDIDAYRRRDQERPHRDTFVGMLPPKLAQIIINLAAGPQTSPDNSTTLLDPFCGTGVVLQEAALMGYRVYGTDLSEKMVRYSQDNLSWLQDNHKFEIGSRYETADATDHVWRQSIGLVATESYLGHPFASEPGREALQETMQTCDVILRKFLRNIGGQIKPGTRLCVAVPAWFTRSTVHHLRGIETVSDQGFTRLGFQHAANADLLYHRPGQFVGRELLVLVKK